MKRPSPSLLYRYAVLVISLLTISGWLLTASCSKSDPGYPDPDPYITGMASFLQADSIRSSVSWLEGMQTRYFLAPNHREVARQLMEKFSGMGYPNVQMDSFLLAVSANGNKTETWQYNVVATLDGEEASDAVIIAGAHYDCIVEDGDPFLYAPGADDNGSGVGALLEIARVLKQQQFLPRIPIRFVLFAAEENDLDGSASFARRLQEQGSTVTLMLNLDMIGYEPEEDPSRWTVNIMDYMNSGDFPETIARVCTQYTTLQYYTDNTYNEEGDSYSFSREGYPALWVISAAENEAYHTTADRLSLCNIPYCREVAALSLALLIDQSR